MSRADEPVVSLDGVKVHFEKEQGLIDSLFGEPDTVGAVDGVSLEIAENDVVALVGESGCGKTTLGKTAIGIQRPTEGSVRYRGQDVWEAKDGEGEIPFEEIRRSLQIIHQDPGSALNPNRTVMRTLTAPLKRRHSEMSPEDRRARVLRMLERVGMEPPEDYAHRYPHQLSGGEQQRIALVRALLMNPDLILADEAVSALDVSLRVEMMDLLLELQEQFDTSFLFISHNLSNARYLAEKSGGRVGIMYLGELVEIGPAEEVLQNPKHPYTKVLRWATADLEPEGEVEEPPVRTIDIPDPVSPPSGCRFHTRCPKVIPPEGTDISQALYNEIMDLRNAVEKRTLRPDEDAPRDAEIARLRDERFDEPLSEPHRERVDRALAAVVDGDWDAAAEALRADYESVCERRSPTLGDERHPTACHLRDEGRRAEPSAADD
ncbi:ABC transporter ATP-binding protein [Halegenticoccus soli]|uniref:ABC transporter ATP-binding protein n=1 Tax=Halegenticoccus soli TaxID=1985678 RepID=UPI0018EA9C7E